MAVTVRVCDPGNPGPGPWPQDFNRSQGLFDPGSGFSQPGRMRCDYPGPTHFDRLEERPRMGLFFADGGLCPRPDGSRVCGFLDRGSYLLRCTTIGLVSGHTRGSPENNCGRKSSL